MNKKKIEEIKIKIINDLMKIKEKKNKLNEQEKVLAKKLIEIENKSS